MSQAVEGDIPLSPMTMRHTWVQRDSIREQLLPMFEQCADIELEIGSGKGLFILRAAQQNPRTFFIGIEIATKFARMAQDRLDRHSIVNGRIFCADAMQVLRDDVPTERLQAVHCYFPDPWWKKRHKKRRVLTSETLRHIERVLKPQGEFHFWTDVLDYFEDTVKSIGAETRLAEPELVPESSAQHDLDYRTHFERRSRLRGLPVYRAVFRRPDFERRQS